MSKFLVLYRMPVGGFDEWMKLPEADRKQMEDALKAEWDVWASKNAAHIKETAGAGKTKLVNTEGIAESRNDVMLYSLIEAASHDEAAKLFEGHPHLKIPGATIEVMTANVLPGMQ